MATYWRYGGKYYMGFVGNLSGFPAVKEFEYPLRIDQVISPWVWCTTFLGDSAQYIGLYCCIQSISVDVRVYKEWSSRKMLSSLMSLPFSIMYSRTNRKSQVNFQRYRRTTQIENQGNESKKIFNSKIITDGTDAFLRVVFFQAGISRVMIRVRSPCDLWYEC